MQFFSPLSIETEPFERSTWLHFVNIILLAIDRTNKIYLVSVLTTKKPSVFTYNYNNYEKTTEKTTL